jgi:uncharacterized protein (DUF1778 family)
MASGDSQLRDDRIDIRVNAQAKALVLRAAELSGQSLSTFIMECASARARQILAEHTVIILTDQARDLLLNTLHHPPPTSPALRRIMAQCQ